MSLRVPDTAFRSCSKSLILCARNVANDTILQILLPQPEEELSQTVIVIVF
jgi:hypothetical protein